VLRRERPAWRSAVPVLLVSGLALVVLGVTPAGALVLQSAGAAGSVSLSWWQAVVLGVVEGITEYLPISSTGHLLIASRLLGLPDEQGSVGLEAVNTYAIAIQFGAIVAVAGLFWRRFRDMLLGLVGRSEPGRHLLLILVIAFLPSAVLGFLFDDAIEERLFGPWPIVVAWVVGGVLILVLERTGRIPSRRDAADAESAGSGGGVEQVAVGRDPLLSISYRQAAIVGLAQCLALWPGTSRSLATILGALLVGVSVAAAVEFSFLLGMVTLLAATVYKAKDAGPEMMRSYGPAVMLVGTVAAWISAIVAVRWMVGYLKRNGLEVFGYYRLAIAAVVGCLLASGRLAP